MSMHTIAETLDTVLDYPVKNGAYTDRHGDTHFVSGGLCKSQMIRMAIDSGCVYESFLDGVFKARGTITVDELLEFHQIAIRDEDIRTMTKKEKEHEDFVRRYGYLASLWWKKIVDQP